MTFDANTILVVVATLAVAAVAFLVLRPRRRPDRLERRGDGGAPYVASQDRPYVKPRTGRDGPQGNSVADEVATAATDVTGEVLGVAARAELVGADNFTLLKGVGPKFASRLNELGLTRYEQLAGLNATEASHLDERLGPFRGRLARDRVVEQARYLARGDTDGFEERFGNLGG